MTDGLKSKAYAIFSEAFEAGGSGEFFGDAWYVSKARAALLRPAETPMKAIDRRDKTLSVFHEGLVAGHSAMPLEYAWKSSESHAAWKRAQSERAR